MNLRTRQHGAALVEVMIAVIVLAIGVLGAVGLQTKSLAALSNAGARVDAAIAAERVIGLMSTDQGNLASYVWNSTGTGVGAAPDVLGNWMTETQALLPNATVVITVTPMVGSSAAQVGVTITWQRRTGVNADPVNTHTIVATLAPTL